MSFHDQALPQDMHQFRFEFDYSLISIENFPGIIICYSVSTNVFSSVSLFKGHVQRLDGHYVRGCGFQRGIVIASSINILMLTGCT